MGEKQVRAATEKAALELLAPKFEVLANLAVARSNASVEELNRLMSDARKGAQDIIEKAKAERAERIERARVALQEARAAGWTPAQLRELQLDPSASSSVAKRDAVRDRLRGEATATGDTAEDDTAEHSASADVG
jgi:hypothetical protein